MICCLLMYLITHSSFGYALIGIRENESRMQGLAIILGFTNIWLLSSVALLQGGGGIVCPFLWNHGSNHFGLLTSSMAVLMVVLGSPGTLYGPLIGSFLILLLEFLPVVTARRGGRSFWAEHLLFVSLYFAAGWASILPGHGQKRAIPHGSNEGPRLDENLRWRSRRVKRFIWCRDRRTPSDFRP